MTPEPIGFFFRERMRGPLSAGTDDSRMGAMRGRAAGTYFTADMTVEIDDLAECIRDPQHAARLEGTVTFPGLATAQKISQGRLQMYVRDPATKRKLMRYEFSFRGDAGGMYFLNGVKFMRVPGPTPREQVTLYTRIHEGSPDGPVWGAGILVFSLRDLPAFLLSMRSRGTSRLRGLIRFLDFVRRELSTPV